MKTNYAGIDYSPKNSTVNRNPNTGIRYGIIAQNSIMPESLSDFEPVYQSDNPSDFEEPIGFEYHRDGYHLYFSGESPELWVFESPYITRCQFCSPCMPGAGNLDSPCDNGIETYCLDSSWFDESEPCPYKYEPAPK